MGRRLDEIVAALPDERRERIEARFLKLKTEVESHRELCQVAGKIEIESG